MPNIKGIDFDFVINIDPGRNVICDICNKDWTDSDVSGGFMFSSSAYCPDCAENGLKNIKRYNEEQYIKGFCPPNMSHADWIRDVVRKGLL